MCRVVYCTGRVLCFTIGMFIYVCSSVLSWRPQLLLIEIVEPVSDLMMAALMLDATQPNPHECTYVNNPKNPEPEGSCTYSKNPEPSGSCTYVPNDAGTGPNPPHES